MKSDVLTSVTTNIFWNVTYTDTSKELAAVIISVDDILILMIDVVVSSETSASIHQATRRHLYL